MSYSDTKNDEYHRKAIACFYDDVEMPGGWSFNQANTLKLIDLYYNSRYKTGQYDRQGYRKFFYNIVKPTCDIATKFIDLDTKDIILTPELGEDEWRIFLMQRRLKQWLKDEDFGVLLNDITFFWPIYGHLVIKKSNKGWKVVYLQNLRCNPAADGIVTGSFAEVYVLGPEQLSNLGWDTEDLYKRGEEEEYVIYDCFDRTADGWHRCVKGDLWSKRKGGQPVRAVESELNYQGEEWIGSVVLFEEDVKEHNYRELKWEHVPGRAMGRGFVEYLEDNQVARNEAENLERKGLAYSALKLWQTRDETVAGKNVLVGAQNGDIVHIESEITPIAMEERNLAQFNETRQNWDMNTERKTFTSDITTGASLPSRTPLGVANLQASLASSFFERKREELGLFIKRLLYDDIIPSFKSDTAKEHALTFSTADEEINYLDDAIINTLVGEKVVAYAQKTGWFPNKEQKDLVKMEVKDKLRGKKNRYLKIPAGFWKNAKYYVDINITGESYDVSVRSQLLQMVIQIMGTNPAAMQNPQTRGPILKLLNMGGISPMEVGLAYQPEEQTGQQPQVAGSLSKPTASAMPAMQRI